MGKFAHAILGIKQGSNKGWEPNGPIGNMQNKCTEKVIMMSLSVVDLAIGLSGLLWCLFVMMGNHYV